MKKILIIFGTRPEAIKMAPVIKELEKHASALKTIVCVTGQHRAMLDQVLRLFEIEPDYDLDVMKAEQSLYEITSNVLMKMKDVIAKIGPDMILVHGDTTTTMAASLAAFFSKIPLGHVEAGLRTGNKRAPFPEEINRKIADSVSDLHFAPTEMARKNLLKEGVAEKSIYVTGNTVIDALLMTLNKIQQNNLEPELRLRMTTENMQLDNMFQRLRAKSGSRMILVTGHRRENFGEGFENICYALKEIACQYRHVEIVYPVHLNPNVREPVLRILSGIDNIHLIEPLDYILFVYLMSRAYLIVTDSGGVQEEAPSLGKPVLVMRDVTERPEAVEAGTVKLVGTDRKKIVESVAELLNEDSAYGKMSRAHNPYGNGHAAKCIVDVVIGQIKKL